MLTQVNQFLQEEPRNDLYKSGLTDETIYKAGIKSVTKDRFKELGLPSNVKSAYEIPYGDGYSRYRLFYEDGYSGRKYHQLEGTTNKLYIPSLARPHLKDITIPLYIVEGEKKALKACQDGLCCIAIGGLWNYLDKATGELIEDFNLIDFQGRIVYIVPDNDYRNLDKKNKPKNLIKAVYRLAYKLIERGAKC